MLLGPFTRRRAAAVLANGFTSVPFRSAADITRSENQWDECCYKLMLRASAWIADTPVPRLHEVLERGFVELRHIFLIYGRPPADDRLQEIVNSMPIFGVYARLRLASTLIYQPARTLTG